jgi:hypothetical protein
MILGLEWRATRGNFGGLVAVYGETIHSASPVEKLVRAARSSQRQVRRSGGSRLTRDLSGVCQALSAEMSLVGHLLGDGGGVADEGSVPPWHDVEAEIAAALDPLVVWPGEYGADQSDQGVAIGEDPDHVGAMVGLAVEPLSRGVRPDLAPTLPQPPWRLDQIARRVR